MTTKASITKKTLSVFLSVLMVLSCCTTLFPGLAERFGLKASAATPTWTDLDNALNTWASNKTNNNAFHVVDGQQRLTTFIIFTHGPKLLQVLLL